ncbi:MAG: GH32 C-terminal domain-containing protein [Acidobacteriota bacterium]
MQTPVRELESLRKTPPRRFGGGSLSAANAWLATQTDLPPQLDIELTFTGVRTASAFSLQLATGTSQRSTVAVDPARGELVVDRARSGQTTFHSGCSPRQTAPLRIANTEVTIRLLLDSSSLEVFAQHGETVLTELIFPGPGTRQLSVETTGDPPRVGEIAIHPLEAASVRRTAVSRQGGPPTLNRPARLGPVAAGDTAIWRTAPGRVAYGASASVTEAETQ